MLSVFLVTFGVPKITPNLIWPTEKVPNRTYFHTLKEADLNDTPPKFNPLKMREDYSSFGKVTLQGLC